MRNYQLSLSLTHPQKVLKYVPQPNPARSLGPQLHPAPLPRDRNTHTHTHRPRARRGAYYSTRSRNERRQTQVRNEGKKTRRLKRKLFPFCLFFLAFFFLREHLLLLLLLSSAPCIWVVPWGSQVGRIGRVGRWGRVIAAYRTLLYLPYLTVTYYSRMYAYVAAGDGPEWDGWDGSGWIWMMKRKGIGNEGRKGANRNCLFVCLRTYRRMRIGMEIETGRCKD